MRNIRRSINLILSLLIGSLVFVKILAQCPGAETCQDAYVFCSLDELNGFRCTNVNGTPNHCSPLCSSNNVACGSLGCLTTWWAFVSEGGSVTISLSVGPCIDFDNDKDLDAVTWGVWGNCNCGEEVFCSAPCQHPAAPLKQSFTANLRPCKIYYLWITGCERDICDFIITTSRGGPPTLDPLGYINNEPSEIIEPVCVGYCNYKFFVDPIQGSCGVTYTWTLDGQEVGGNSNTILLNFPDEGDFKICVSAYTGQTGSFCSAATPKCATVKVRPSPDKIGVPRNVCSGFEWHSQMIYTSGIYREHLQDNKCCQFDSVVEFRVPPDYGPKEVYYISCDNKSFVDILGRHYLPCQDHLEISLPKTTELYKCDSAIILTAVNVEFLPNWTVKCLEGKVELSPNARILNPCNVGESYKLDYSWYIKSDSRKKSISTKDHLVVDTLNEDYCFDVNIKVRLGNDSTICIKTFCDTINEAEVKSTTNNIALHFCDSAFVNGQKYVQSTQLTQQLKNVYGCDSILITDLNITKSSVTKIDFSSCDSASIGGRVYTQSGNYTQVLINSNLCDSILNIDLSIQNSSNANLVFSSCDSIVVNGKIYNQSGSFSQLLTNSNGCDSILNLDLNIFPKSTQRFSFSACDSVAFNGTTYTKSGDYSQTYISSNGCDSIVNIHVNIPNSNVSPILLSSCDSAKINGSTYTQSGKYTQFLKSFNGCDSTLVIDLTIAKSNSSNFSLTACDSAIINAKRYYQSGNYNQVLQNASHCDSTINIDLHISKSNSASLNLTSCDSILVNGQVYSQTGSYNQLLKNTGQCDSVLTVNYNRLIGSLTNLNFASCDSLIVNGQTYVQTGNYSQKYVNSNGCDSILNLSVKITKSNSSNLSMSGCDSAIVNGKLYKQSGNYVQVFKNAYLCDSLLNIKLNIFKSSSINYVLSSCDSAIINGQLYKQSGSYTQNLKSVNQCDSTIHIQFNLLKASDSTLTKNVCDSISINGTTYYASGSFSQKMLNSNGCDSTLALELTIKPGNPSILEAGKDTSICFGEIINLNGVFSGPANFIWHSQHGSFDNPINLNTFYYPANIGDERIYLNASDECKQWLDSLAVHVFPKQIIQITGDTILDPCKDISFIASGGTNYIWTPASLIECLDPACKRVKLKSTGTFKFSITTDGPCVVPASLSLSELQVQSDLFVPNVFSPNGDNINDEFRPVINCDKLDYYNLQIFDRWGNLVFESQNKNLGWNGKYQDVNMNPGVYPYVINYQLHNSEKKVRAGDVTLIR